MLFLVASTASRAAPPATSRPSPAVPREQSVELRRQARGLMDNRNWAGAARLVARGASVRDSAERAAWLCLEAELEFGRGRFIPAALAGMRLSILHPNNRQAGAGYYWAGRAYEELGRPAKSIELYEECLASRRTPEGVRRLAESRLAALKGNRK
jgi:tetratricopeptide (TPR) repeat protein